MYHLVITELVVPIAVALLVTVVKSRLYAGILSVLASITSLIISSILYVNVVYSGPQRIELLSNWLVIPGIKPVSISFIIDPLSTLVGILLCSLSTIILIYSIGYLSDDYYDSRRYWFLMLIFITSMLIVVYADNFILLFIGWEGVSICSYLLIGYYYGDEKEHWIGGPPSKAPLHPPSYCSFRTLITVGSADSVMLVGILTLVVLTGSPYYEDLESIKSLVSSGLPVWSVLTPLILFLTGPLAKSAQFPLHMWLPYAMAGPTPVSALLHSATMVKAGVYLIIRLLPELVGISEGVSEVSIIFTLLAVAGVLSMIDGAVNAGRAIELKKVLAYSTISQIGYMFLILGIAGLTETITNGIAASLYHMMSHAVFKSALFLIAGILIHLSGTIYLTGMEFPLKNRNNLILFLITLISCLNLLGIPPLIGFWSKEFIIEIIHFKELYIPLSIVIITTFLTAFYATRMIILIFLGHKTPYKLHDTHGVSKLMLYPVISLITTMVYVGVIGYWFRHSLIDVLRIVGEEVEYISTNPLITWLTISVTVLGVILALIRYELMVIHLISSTNITNLISYVVNYLIHIVLRLSTPLRRGVTLLMHTVGGGIAREIREVFNLLEYTLMYAVGGGIVKNVRDVFNQLENTLDATMRYVGMVVFRYLSILFKMINYADMDSFLTLYLLTLTMILTYVLIMYNLHLLITG